MNTFVTTEWVPSLRPDPEKRRLTSADHKKRLLEITLLVQDTKRCKALAAAWTDSPTKLWTIQCYDNRLADLMNQASATAMMLTQAHADEQGIVSSS